MGDVKPGAIGPLISGGATLLGDVVGSIVQGAQNRQQRQFALDMYNRQRTDALADWNMQNAYNSPASQMARLKAAGLNPNLVYGNGAVANNTSGVRSASQGNYNPHAPNWANIPGDFVGAYYDAQIKQATVDNLAEQRKVMQTTAAKNMADIILKGVNSTRGKQVIQQSGDLFGTVMETAKANLQAITTNIAKTQADTQFTLDANERAELMTANNIAQGVERIALMRAQIAHTDVDRQRIIQTIENLKKTGLIQDFEIQLNKKGLTRNDEYYYRIGSKLVDLITGPQSTQAPKPGVDSNFKRFWHDAFNGLLDF